MILKLQVMAIVKALKGKHPTIGKNCFLAENATIIGDVTLGNDCSVWYSAVIRGDVHYIRIGDYTNIQDCAVIHATYQRSPTTIGSYVTIAHGAIVHGCTIQDDAIVESNSIIAAGSVVTKSTQVKAGSVYAGIPAKKVKTISPELLEGEINRIANSYGMYAGWYKE